METSRVTYRQARATDMAGCVRVFLRSAADLSRRHGEPPPQLRSRAGLRTVFFGAWMSAKPIGSFESYLLAGGMLL